MAMPQTWHLLRAKKLTAGDIPNGKCWEEFDKESHPKSKSLGKAYPYLEALSKMSKGIDGSCFQVHLSISLPFPVLKFCLSEVKGTGDSGRQHKPATKPLLVLR